MENIFGVGGSDGGFGGDGGSVGGDGESVGGSVGGIADGFDFIGGVGDMQL